MLRHIEGLAAEQPRAADMVSGWFNDVAANKLIAAGMISLGDLNSKISVGGRWFSAMPAIGKAKAQRIGSHLTMLLPREVQSLEPVLGLSATLSFFCCPHSFRRLDQRAARAKRCTVRHGALHLTATSQQWSRSGGGLDQSPGQLVGNSAGLPARGIPLVARLQYECAGATLSQMSVNLCGDYMAFLQNIPAKWISCESAKLGMPGWTPFRPLSHTSHRQAIVIIASLFTWLQAAQYLQANPWSLVDQKTGGDLDEKMLDTKALSESAMLEIMRFIDAQAPSPTRSRIRFILKFVEVVSLRSAELLSAERREPEGWVMQIHGKGAKNRIAAVPGQAFLALQEYLDVRGLGSIGTAPPNASPLASARDPMEPVGYRVMYEHVKDWLSKAVSASALYSNERMKLASASTHWRRHTFDSRAISREVPLDVIHAQMGHASIQMTTSIYGRAPIKRRVDEPGKAFG